MGSGPGHPGLPTFSLTLVTSMRAANFSVSLSAPLSRSAQRFTSVLALMADQTAITGGRNLTQTRIHSGPAEVSGAERTVTAVRGGPTSTPDRSTGKFYDTAIAVTDLVSRPAAAKIHMSEYGSCSNYK